MAVFVYLETSCIGMVPVRQGWPRRLQNLTTNRRCYLAPERLSPVRSTLSFGKAPDELAKDRENRPNLADRLRRVYGWSALGGVLRR